MAGSLMIMLYFVIIGRESKKAYSQKFYEDTGDYRLLRNKLRNFFTSCHYFQANETIWQKLVVAEIPGILADAAICQGQSH